MPGGGASAEGEGGAAEGEWRGGVGALEPELDAADALRGWGPPIIPTIR